MRTAISARLAAMTFLKMGIARDSFGAKVGLTPLVQVSSAATERCVEEEMRDVLLLTNEGENAMEVLLRSSREAAPTAAKRIIVGFLALE